MKFLCKFKKIIGGILMGFGIGILLVLFLPTVVWMCLMGIALLGAGIAYLK